METYWAYNGLDCAITREVFDVLQARLTPELDRTYRFEMAMQAPAFQMMLRGIAVDDIARGRALRDLEKLEKDIERELVEIVSPSWEFKKKRGSKCEKAPAWGKKYHKWPQDAELDAQHCEFCGVSRLVSDPFNPRSPKQVIHLLYKVWGLPEQFDRKTHKVSVGEESIEKLRKRVRDMKEEHPVWLRTFELLLEARKTRKQIGFMRSELGPDSRMHSSFNVGATETFRWSSSQDPYRRGCNIQQIADPWRNVFVADPGMEIFYADLEQAESRVVAYDAQDEAFIAVHAASDTHTEVAKMLWPEIVVDKATAQLPTPWDSDPQHNYRFYAKKIVHGSNLGMTPTGIAREAHISKEAAEEMQARYFDAFPRVKARQKEIAQELRETGKLTNPLGVVKQFFGRLWDDHTIKEGYSFTPQSMVGFILSIGLWRVWDRLDPGALHVLAQVHDAILGQYPIGQRDAVLGRVLELMTVPVEIRGRTLTIPVEIAYGKNWRKSDMTKWQGKHA